MSSTHRFVAALVCAVLAAGCSDSKKPPAGGGSVAASVAPPAAMLDLLPEGTVGVVYIPSLKKLEDGIRRLAATVDEKEAATIKVSDLSEMVGGLDPADLDMAGGAAIAMTLGADAEMPGVTAVLPVRDEKVIASKMKAKNPGAAVEVGGGFTAITPMGAYKRAGMPARLAGALPPGDLVVRLDAATLAKTLGPMALEKAKEQIEAMRSISEASGAPSQAETMRSMLDGLKSVLDASSVWDIALRIDGTTVEAEIAVTFTDRTHAPLLDMFVKADLPGLARNLPNEGMLSLAMAVDPERAWPAMAGFLKASNEVLPPAQREALQKMFDAAGGAVKSLGHGMVATGGITSSGLECAYVIETPDGAAFIKSIANVASSVDLKDSFMTISPLAERIVDGTKVSTLTLKIIPERLPELGAKGMPPGFTREIVSMVYGKGGLTYSVADFGKRVVLVIGGDEALKRALKAAKAGDSAPAGPLAKALAAAGPDTVGYARADLRGLMREVFRIMKQAGGDDMPKLDIPAGDPVIVTAIANAGPNQVRGRLSLDVGMLATMVKAMMPK